MKRYVWLVLLAMVAMPRFGYSVYIQESLDALAIGITNEDLQEDGTLTIKARQALDKTQPKGTHYTSGISIDLSNTKLSATGLTYFYRYSEVETLILNNMQQFDFKFLGTSKIFSSPLPKPTDMLALLKQSESGLLAALAQGKFPWLKKLDLSGNQMKQIDFWALCVVLEQYGQSIETLNLRKMQIDKLSDALLGTAKVYGGRDVRKELNSSEFGLFPALIKGKLSKLKRLDLSDNSMNEDIVSALNVAMRQLYIKRKVHLGQKLDFELNISNCIDSKEKKLLSVVEALQKGYVESIIGVGKSKQKAAEPIPSVCFVPSVKTPETSGLDGEEDEE